MTRSLGTLLLTLLMAVATLTDTAMAQDYPRRRTLLDLLFGSPAPEQPRYDRRPFDDRRAPGVRSRKKAAPTAKPVASPRPRALALPSAPPAPAKIDNAQKILVIGDFFASGLGDGLKEAFRDAPGTQIETRSNGSSGLVRDDYFDWRKQLPKMLDDIKPAIVVVALGTNDRQQMPASGGDQRFPSDGWFKDYEKRVDGLVKVITARKIPLIWVGLPPVKSPGMSADLVKFNALYRKATEQAGAEFIDIWDGFVDENGAFVLTGSDVNGQQARLRGPDGISMTDAGKRKMAFYLEKSARKYLGDMASPGLVRLDATSLPELTTPQPPKDNPDSTPPMKIIDPALDGGDTLLGAKEKPVALKPPSPRDLLVTTGIMPEPPQGRVDDYRVMDTSQNSK
ncbi:hypothetical protein H4S14_000556 [Agrobacterium vitis]|nr:hypothetical protein [Agrobacterium vitis]MBE1436829.1 hypothetical protein [Agrobacterium vitis]